MRKKKVLLITCGLLLVGLLSGCRAISYYGQAIGGQFEIFQKQKPIKKVLASSGVSPKLKQKLDLILELREFAQAELNLPPDEHYLRYADLGREHVVWNVHAAPEFSLKPKTWWYPFVGSAKYRGYFSEKEARDYAAVLKKQGLDVHFEGVDAYSTLGWFKDPVLNTFVFDSDISLAETIFHELAHQKVFASGDTDFNEAFATAVAHEGLRRWIDPQTNPEAYAKYQTRIKRQSQFVDLVQNTRAELKALYAGIPTGDDGEPLVSPEQAAGFRDEKAKIIAGLRTRYEKLKQQEWDGYAGYDKWFSGPLNNAQLNTVAAYFDLVPAFTELLASKGNDLGRFYGAVEKLAELPKKERHAQLKTYLGNTEVVAEASGSPNVK